ncbi:MAG: MSHA pilin protein MshD [Paraglaciecola sp.]|jgi:MSHA pilin protein MshD
MFANKLQCSLLKPRYGYLGSQQNRGFTLIELVVGIVVFAVALSLFISLLVPQAIKSIDPIYQVRATELAQSLLNEISSKSFDENSSRSGDLLRCNEVDAPPCTANGDLGPDLLGTEFEIRADFNDVDDYHNLSEEDGEILNSLGETITINSIGLYQGFQANVSVIYDDDVDGIDDGVIGNRKLIVVSIVTPNDEALVFSTYRNNY